MNQDDIVRYYEGAGLDYQAWSPEFNMHFGYWRPWLSPFRREPMLEEMNRQVHALLQLNETGTVYDLGCGLGASMRSLARRHPAQQVVGVTLVEWQRQQATRLNAAWSDRLRVEVRDYTQLGLSEQADAAYALESSCYAPGESKAPFLRNLYDLLKPGGLFVVADGFTKRRRRPALLNWMLGKACRGWALECFPCLEPFTDSLRELGFVDVRVREISWQLAPSVFHSPWLVTRFTLQKLLEGDKLDDVRWRNLEACFLSLAIGLFRPYYGYYLVSGRKP